MSVVTSSYGAASSPRSSAVWTPHEHVPHTRSRHLPRRARPAVALPPAWPWDERPPGLHLKVREWVQRRAPLLQGGGRVGVARRDCDSVTSTSGSRLLSFGAFQEQLELWAFTCVSQCLEVRSRPPLGPEPNKASCRPGCPRQAGTDGESRAAGAASDCLSLLQQTLSNTLCAWPADLSWVLLGGKCHCRKAGVTWSPGGVPSLALELEMNRTQGVLPVPSPVGSSQLQPPWAMAGDAHPGCLLTMQISVATR